MQGGEWYNGPRAAYEGGPYDWELDELVSKRVCPCATVLYLSLMYIPMPQEILDGNHLGNIKPSSRRAPTIILRRTMILTTAS
jgi:hypothetical protein